MGFELTVIQAAWKGLEKKIILREIDFLYLERYEWITYLSLEVKDKAIFLTISRWFGPENQVQKHSPNAMNTSNDLKNSTIFGVTNQMAKDFMEIWQLKQPLNR